MIRSIYMIVHDCSWTRRGRAIPLHILSLAAPCRDLVWLIKGWYDSRMITNGASSIWTSNPKNANNLRLSQKWARLDESHMTWFLTNKDQIHKDSHFLISKKDNFAFFENTTNFDSQRYWSNLSSRWSWILWLVFFYKNGCFYEETLKVTTALAVFCPNAWVK